MLVPLVFFFYASVLEQTSTFDESEGSLNYNIDFIFFLTHVSVDA